MNDLDTLIGRIRAFAEQHPDIAAVYLFGSRATGKNRPNSDADISLLMKRYVDGFKRIEWETLLSNLLGCDVDLCIFAQSNPLLQHQILKYGKLVYEKDRIERVRQEVFARHEYLDSKFLFREIRDNENG